MTSVKIGGASGEYHNMDKKQYSDYEHLTILINKKHFYGNKEKVSEFDGKVAIVSGGGSGIGAETARLLSV